MDKGYLHVEIEAVQTSKRSEAPCGDVYAYERTVSDTTLVLSDGIGSGIKANIAAQMCVSGILELIRQGYSVRKAFASLVQTMEATKGTDMPYAVFTVVRILSDGVATVLSYEMPPPILVTPKYAQVLPQRTTTLESSLISEATCHLEPGEGIVVMSDGITQAGLGKGLSNGWTVDGVSQYINDLLSDRIPVREIPASVHRQAKVLWKTAQGDDCTVLLAVCRRGKTVNILTGPPRDPKKDRSVIKDFLMRPGTKVISGGTTAKIVADFLGVPVLVESNPQSMLAPAKYEVPGIDLVTEGAITLNQVYNVLDEDPENFDEESGVTELHDLLRKADRVNFIVGRAINPAAGDIAFRQKGILTRQTIVPLLADKLRAAGKLVVVDYV